VGEDLPGPVVEVVVDAERPAGYPRVSVEPQLLADLGLPSAADVRPRDDLAVAHDLERAEREDAAHRGMDADRSRPGQPDGIARLAPVDRERQQRPAGQEGATGAHGPAPGVV